MKKFVSLILAAAIAVSSLPMTASAKGAANADLNRDGSVNVTDLVMLAAHIKNVKMLRPNVYALADINGDGMVNVTDLSSLAYYVKGGDSINADRLAREHAKIINDERRYLELRPYKYSPELTDAAMKRAEEITRSYGHKRPDGSEWHTVLNEYGISPLYIKAEYAAENICKNYSTPKAAFEAFMDSPQHRKSMLSSDYEYMGIGVARGTDGYLYWVQLYAAGIGMTGETV